MSLAEDLLNSLPEDQPAVTSADPATEPHIVINADKTVTIPEALQRILVQHDHNIETVTFDCPRYWDGHDLSQMDLRIVFQRSDGHKEPHPVENLRIDESDDQMIHFDWTISGNTTLTSGNVKITVCAKLTNAEGVSEREWHTIPNQDLFVNEGMECSGEEIVERNPDVIEYILAELDELKSAGGNGSREDAAYPDWSHLKWHIIGDSLTDRNNNHTVNRYYDFISKATGIQLSLDGIGGTGYGAGVSTNQHFVERVKNIPDDADIVTIFGSANDIKHANGANSEIFATLSWITLNRPGLRCIVVPPAPVKWYDRRAEEWTAYNDRLKLCAFVCGHRYVADMYECPPFDPNNEQHMAVFFTTDPEGIHPNEAGHKAMAPIIYNALLQELELENGYPRGGAVGDGQNVELEDKIPENGGTTDYTALSNKPSINGVELNGNKTAEELGIGQPTDEQVGAAVGEWLEAHPEATTVVADRSITAAKTTFIEPVAQNLIDISKMVKGGIAEATGEIGTTSGYTSDYIPVETGKTYRCNVGFGTGGNWASYYYDKDRQKLSIIEGNPFTVPEGAAYARLTWYYNDDPAVKKYALFEGGNLWPYTQGTQRYELDAMLTEAVERVVDRYAAVKAVPKNLYRQAGYGNVNGATGVIDCGDAGSLRVSDYIELTPGVWYITNCLSAPGFTACYDADKKYVAAFADAAERIDASGYYAFRVTDPNVRYIVNGCERSISKPIAEPFFCRGSTVPETFDGYDVAVPQADVIPALKNLLGITANDLAGLTWAVLGDSITAAPGLERNYHGIIGEKLGLTSINYGYSGSWISHTDAMPEGNEMCVCYATMTDDADIITCFGGINDINNGAALGEMGDTESTTFYGAMDILIQGLLRKYPGKRIGFITPLRYGDGAKAKLYIEAIHEVCEKYAVPVLDLYREGMASTATEELSATYFKDGLHPNELGHDVIARKVEAFLKRL